MFCLTKITMNYPIISQQIGREARKTVTMVTILKRCCNFMILMKVVVTFLGSQTVTNVGVKGNN